MSKPTVHGNRAIYSASNALRCLGDALGEIRQQDGLTWGELGRVFGKSDDQAAKYADGTAEMGVVAYGLAVREWGSRFDGPFRRLIEGSRPQGACDNAVLLAIIGATLEIQKAKASGDIITPDEIDMARPQIEAARDALDELLSRGSKFPSVENLTRLER